VMATVWRIFHSKLCEGEGCTPSPFHSLPNESLSSTAPVFIDSQPGGPVRLPYLLYRPGRLHRLLKRLQIRHLTEQRQLNKICTIYLLYMNVVFTFNGLESRSTLREVFSFQSVMNNGMNSL